jgi:hypothetical protein
MNLEEKAKYEELLKNPKLFDIITLQELDKKIAGEIDTRRAIFLALCGIFVKNKQGMLNICVNSESSAGKSFICSAIIKIFPTSRYEYRTKITPEVLTYWHNDNPAWTWDGRILYLEDIRDTILNSDALKVMVSEGSIATILMKQKVMDMKINGKPLVLCTMRNPNPKIEIINRFNLINLDESEIQTKLIAERLCKVAEFGEGEKYDEELIEAITLLNNVRVYIPFANKLLKIMSLKDIRFRRANSAILDLIKASCAFHQYQRKQEHNHIIAEKEDYELAREAIKKFDILLPPLTFRHKRALKVCEKLSLENEENFDGWFSAKEVYTKDAFISQVSWYAYLDILQQAGFLETSLRFEEGVKQAIKKYRVVNLNFDDLPAFEDIETFERMEGKIMKREKQAQSELKIEYENIENTDKIEYEKDEGWTEGWDDKNLTKNPCEICELFPTNIAKNGKYYCYFCFQDIHNKEVVK